MTELEGADPPAPSNEQERIRIDGLRVLARIISRRALADPHLSVSRSPEERLATPLTGHAEWVREQDCNRPR